jgi:hypothetical protein
VFVLRRGKEAVQLTADIQHARSQGLDTGAQQARLKAILSKCEQLRREMEGTLELAELAAGTMQQSMSQH